MSSVGLEAVRRQFELADARYKKSISGLTANDVKNMDDFEKQVLLHDVGEAIESYLKSLLLWKGKSWNEMKSLGHNLLKLYDCLDPKGQEIFSSLFSGEKTKAITNNFMNHNHTSQTIKAVNKIIPGQFNVNTIPRGATIPISLSNGLYDGDATILPNYYSGIVENNHLEALLKSLNSAQLRYATANFDYIDDDILIYLDVAKNLKTLSDMARSKEDYISNTANNKR